MYKIFFELKTLREIVEKLSPKYNREDLVYIPIKIPIPNFEEFEKYFRKKHKNRTFIFESEDKIENKKRELKVLQSKYLKTINDRLYLSVYYIDKYEEVWYKFYQGVKYKRINENFLKENLYEVVELLAGRLILQMDVKDKDIAKVMPKPSEEEFCKEHIKMILLAREKVEYYKRKYSQSTDEEILNLSKKEYQIIIQDLQSILTWYKIKEFKEKQKKRELRHINKLRAIFQSKGISEDKLEEELRLYLDNKQFKEIRDEETRLFKYYRYRRFYYNYEPEPQSYDDLLNQPPLYYPLKEKNTDAYTWLQDYGDYGTLKGMGLLPDEWYEP